MKNTPKMRYFFGHHKTPIFKSLKYSLHSVPRYMLCLVLIVYTWRDIISAFKWGQLLFLIQFVYFENRYTDSIIFRQKQGQL